LLALLAVRAATSGYDPPGRLLAIVPYNPPSRTFFLAMLIVVGATWMACVIIAIRGTRRSVWTEQTKRAIFGVVTLPILAAIFAAGTFHHC
jgi:predicted permease